MSVSTQDSSLQWKATKTGDWITITGASGTGPGSIQWTAAANTTNASRSGTISVTPSGIVAQVLTITQAAQVITATITLTPSSVAAPASASNGPITVTSTNQSLTWTAVPSNSWLTITRRLGNWKRLVPVQRRGKSERRGPDGDDYRDAFQRDGRRAYRDSSRWDADHQSHQHDREAHGGHGHDSRVYGRFGSSMDSDENRGLDHDYGGSHGDWHRIGSMDRGAKYR